MGETAKKKLKIATPLDLHSVTNKLTHEYRKHYDILA